VATDNYRQSPAGAGDVNGDGYGDLVVGAYQVGDYTGRGYLYTGSAGPFATSPAVTFAAPEGRSSSFGWWVASARTVPRRAGSPGHQVPTMCSPSPLLSGPPRPSA
jgi:hypothetical protein